MRVLLVALLAAISYAQTEHTVAWTAGFGNADARTTTAAVGDTLKFEWSGPHNVYKMPDATALGNCDFSSATEVCAQANSDGGSCTANLDALPAYFACEVSGHCSSGQHLTVTESPTTTTTTTTTIEGEEVCPSACATAISGAECPFADISSLEACADMATMASCVSDASEKATECANNVTGDCPTACTNAINDLDCSTVTDTTTAPSSCGDDSQNTGCMTVLADKVAACAARDCPSACYSAIENANCDTFEAAATANLEDCGEGDVFPCRDITAAKVQTCGSDGGSCPSACGSAISGVSCPFSLSDVTTLSDCGFADMVNCRTTAQSKIDECDAASGLSVMIALIAFAFSQF